MMEQRYFLYFGENTHTILYFYIKKNFFQNFIKKHLTFCFLFAIISSVDDKSQPTMWRYSSAG